MLQHTPSVPPRGLAEIQTERRFFYLRSLVLAIWALGQVSLLRNCHVLTELAHLSQTTGVAFCKCFKPGKAVSESINALSL